jgi:hypothetical protein
MFHRYCNKSKYTIRIIYIAHVFITLIEYINTLEFIPLICRKVCMYISVKIWDLETKDESTWQG